MIGNTNKYGNFTKLILKKIFKVDLDEITSSIKDTQFQLDASKNSEKQLAKDKAEAEKRASDLNNILKDSKDSLDSVQKENTDLKSKHNELQHFNLKKKK